MKLSEAIAGQRPAPHQPEAHGVRQVAFNPGGYSRADTKQIEDQLRNGIKNASATVDDLGIGLCGLLEGGPYAHCEADFCYPSVFAMQHKAFSNCHGRIEDKPNPFPPGCTTDNPDERWDAERVESRIKFASQVAQAAAESMLEARPAPIPPDPQAVKQAIDALNESLVSKLSPVEG
jgi:hypothetical protein